MNPLSLGKILKFAGVAVGAVAILAGISAGFLIDSLYLWWESAHGHHSLFAGYNPRYWMVRAALAMLAFVLMHLVFRRIGRWMLQPQGRLLMSRDVSRILMGVGYLIGAAVAVFILIPSFGS